MVPLLPAFALLLSAPQATPPPPESAGLSLVVVVDGWPEFHYAGCPRLERAVDTLVVSRGRATSKGLKPHDDCDPFHARPAEAKEKPPAAADSLRLSRPAPRPPAPSHVVYVVPGDRRYHRADCSKIGLGARRVSMELLRRHAVPCPVCKPPARPASR